MEQPATPTGDATAGDYPDWLAEATVAQPAATADDDLPDWLMEARADQPAEAAGDDDYPDWLAVASGEQPAGDEFPKWFSDAAEESRASVTSVPAGDDAADWLAGMGGEPVADAQASPAVEDFSDWLQDEEPEPAGDGDDIFDEDLPDWLKDAPLSPADSQLKGGTDELSQWLVDAIETEPAQVATTEASPTEDTPDWLHEVQSLGTAAEAAIFGEEPALPGQADESEAPDWLSAQMGLDEETAASIFTLADEEDSGAFPDWLSAAEPEAPAKAAAPLPKPEQPSPSDDLPDWIKEMAPRNTGLLNTGNLPAMDEEAAEDNLDWLAEVSPEAEARSGTGPLAEIDLPDALPDWLADLAPPDTGSLGRPRTGGLDKPRTGPLPSDTLKAAGKSELEEPDWLADLLPPDTGVKEELPPAAPPRRRLPDVPVTELPSSRERRTGPLTPPPPPSQELEGVPTELASADLPEWLTSELGPPPGPGEPVSPLLRDLPDWLDASGGAVEQAPGAVLGPPPEGLTGAEWQDILSGLPPGSGAAASAAVATADADIPAWLQALRPRALTPAGQAEAVADEPAITTGPLAGVRGAIEIEAAAAQPHEAKRLSPATISKDQQRQMALLRQLVRDDQKQAIPVDRRPAAAASLGARLLLSLGLLLAVVAGLVLPDYVPTAPPPLPLASQDMQGEVTTATGKPVLVVFDYSPAMAGELNPQARMLLDQLRDNGSTIYAASQFVTGEGIARQLELDPPLDPPLDTTFIAGEAIGLRWWAACLRGEEVCQTVSGEALPADIALIVLVTGERDSLTGWVEQVASATETPVVAAVTQAVAPVALSYASTGQLRGVMSGLPAAAAYESQYRPGETGLADQLAGQTLAQWTVIILLIVGNVAGWLYSLRPSAKKGSAS